jgi:glycosyltransferase involved in cell wall biosynthesis
MVGVAVSENELPVKIVHVIGALVAGGAERFVISLACELRRAGVDASVWALSPRSDIAGEQMAAVLRATRVPFHAGPTARVGFRSILWYRALCARESPRVLHLHTPNTERMNFLARLAPISGAPAAPLIVRTVHSTALPERAIDRLAYRNNRVTYSIACGAAVAETHAPFLSGPVLTIPNGVEFSAPLQSTEGKRSARALLGLDGADFHVVHVGRMSGTSLGDAQKAHDVLIRAWQQSNLGRHAGVLHLIGDGNLRAALQRQADGDPSIRFHGVRHDVSTWLEAADCFVLPSRYEGLSMVAIEAIGAGVPCLFADNPSLRELEAPGARWCEVNDAPGLAIQLLKMRELCEQPSAEAVLQFRKKHSLGRTARGYHALYQQYA